jgi:hypothetical protein
MTTQTIWHGTEQESFELVNAVARNCTCEFGLMGVRKSTCPAHAAMVTDQRFMDGMVFERRRLASRMPGAGQRVIRDDG